MAALFFSGNFLPSQDITSSEGTRRELMQAALPALVLDSQAIKRSAMNGTPGNSDAEKPATAVSDEQLMAAFAGGSKDAFAELFSRYKQPLYGFFRRRVAEPAHAEELTQETFLAILRASSRYEPSALFRTYLYAIAFKILHAHRRKAAFRAMFHADAATHKPTSRTTLDPSLVLRDAVHRLDPHDREILLLREFEQLS